jgi:hypothetical protein
MTQASTQQRQFHHDAFRQMMAFREAIHVATTPPALRKSVCKQPRAYRWKPRPSHLVHQCRLCDRHEEHHQGGVRDRTAGRLAERIHRHSPSIHPQQVAAQTRRGQHRRGRPGSHRPFTRMRRLGRGAGDCGARLARASWRRPGRFEDFRHLSR